MVGAMSPSNIHHYNSQKLVLKMLQVRIIRLIPKLYLSISILYIIQSYGELLRNVELIQDERFL